MEQLGPPLDYLSAKSEAPTHQQINQDDLNLRFDSNLTTQRAPPFTQQRGFFEDRSFEPHSFEAQQQSLQRDSGSVDITTPLCEGEQEKHSSSLKASLNSYETS
jgi:hypothetical protein